MDLPSSDISRKTPRIFTFEMHQDDPSKCTSAKMRRFGFARAISKGRIPSESIVLNPSPKSLTLLPSDRYAARSHGLVVIDCSWAKAEPVFSHHFKGTQRHLPALLAGNPTNYSKLGRLSSIEAAAAALFIMGFKQESRRILSIYKWGETFLSLNQNALEDYSLADTMSRIHEIEKSYFPLSLEC